MRKNTHVVWRDQEYADGAFTRTNEERERPKSRIAAGSGEEFWDDISGVRDHRLARSNGRPHENLPPPYEHSWSESPSHPLPPPPPSPPMFAPELRPSYQYEPESNRSFGVRGAGFGTGTRGGVGIGVGIGYDSGGLNWPTLLILLVVFMFGCVIGLLVGSRGGAHHQPSQIIHHHHHPASSRSEQV